MAAITQYVDTVQLAYIAYYGRPADIDGLDYWTNEIDKMGGDWSQLIDAFGNSFEATSMFVGMSMDSRVNVLYQQIFGRDVDAEGLAFYSQGIADGTFSLASVAVNIINGAKGDDQTIVDNKLKASNDFVALSSDNHDAIASYTFNTVEMVRDWLHNVSADTLSVQNVGDLLSTMQGQGETFTLTENYDITKTAAVIADIDPVITHETYWGYNPHAHDASGVDNLAGNVNNLTNEGPIDGGVPLSELLDYIQNLAGIDFVQLGLINVANGTDNGVDDGGVGTANSSVQTYSDAVTNIAVNQNDNNTQTITVTLDDGTVNTAEVSLGDMYFNLLKDALYDAEGNSRLYQVEIHTYPQVPLLYANGAPVLDFTNSTIGEQVYGDLRQIITKDASFLIDITPIILTTTQNNGGTEESGFTNFGDDLIVAGRLDLLHGAYIDAGEGYNTLEIDAKGYFAQPKELLNIQHITIENLPNIYTDVDSNGNIVNVYPDLVESGAADADSVIDISRAIDLETITITEGAFEGLGGETQTQPGTLTVTGIRNGVTARFEGGFTQEVTLHYGEGITGELNIQLAVGDVTTGFNIVHNAAVLNVDSLGIENHLHHFNSGAGSLSQIYITGTGAFRVDEDLAGSFNAGAPAIIDASENTGGIGVTLNGHHDLTVTGTQTDDEITALNSAKVNIDAANGDNIVNVDGSARVNITTGTGNDEITAKNGTIVAVNAGDGANQVNADGGDTVTIVTEAGNDNISAQNGGSVTVTAGEGANVIDVDGTDNVNVTSGTGADSITAVGSIAVNINAGDGDNVITASGHELDVTTGIGADLVSIAGTAGSLSSSASAGLNLMLILDDSGSMSGTRVAALKAGMTDLFDNLENSGIDTAAVTVVFTSSATSSEWGTISDARTIVDALAASGGTDYNAAITGAMTAWAQPGKIAGANNVSLFVSDATDGLSDTSAWETFLNDNGIVSQAVGLDVNSVSGLDDVAFDGVNDAQIDPVLTDATGLGAILTGIGDGLIGNAGKQALVHIDMGEGQNTLVLGDDTQLTQGLVALEGSSITGENINMIVNVNSDLRAATLSGINSVVLDNSDVGSADLSVTNGILTILASQFADIGAENFSVEGAIFNTHAFINIIVDESTSLTDLGIANLSANIDLRLEVQDGVTLTMTAEQLHTRVAQNGVTLANDGNSDIANGRVVVQDGGLNFDPFNSSDQIHTIINGMNYIGGSLSSDFKTDGNWYNVQANSEVNGYDRPADVASQVVLTLDSTGSDTLTQGAFSTWHNNLEVIGDQDIDFTGAVFLGMEQGVPTTPFNIDFSALEGVANNFTVENFELLGQGGSIVGNADNGYASEVLISIADDDQTDNVGFDESDAGTLVSRGVSRYIVTVIDGPTANGSDGNTATIKLCDTAQDIEVFALRGNYNDTLIIEDAAWGLQFELQGGGTAKAEGPTGTSNVGVLSANYEWDHADATVTLTHSVAGDTRDIHAEGITIDNADSITINANDDTSSIIEDINGDSVESLDVNALHNVSIVSSLPAALTLIDASGVMGTFAAVLDTPTVDYVFTGAEGGSSLTIVDDGATAGADTVIDGGVGGVVLTIDGDNNFEDATLINVDGVILTQGTTLDLTVTQGDTIGAANFSLAAGDNAATLNLSGLDGEEFAIANYATGITIGILTIADLPIVNLHANTDLTGVAALSVPAGTVLNMTAAQYQQLDNAGTITGFDAVGASTGFTVNITGLTQADVDAGFDLSGVSADNATVTLAESVVLTVADVLGSFDVNIGDDMTLTLPTIEQADGLTITGGTNSTLEFTDTTADSNDTIDASNFDVTYLRMLNLLVANLNVDYIFAGIRGSVEKVIYNGEGWTTTIDQTADVEEGTTVPGDVGFNTMEPNTEIRDFTLNLTGGTEVDGDLILDTTDKFNDIDGDGAQDVGENDLMRGLLRTLTINSMGIEENLITGEAANVIDGWIDPSSLSGVSTDNNLLTVEINADQELMITGGIIFSSVTGDDAFAANDNDAAEATVTISGTADVALGKLDGSDDDVDAITVVNNGTGTVTATIDATLIDDNGGDNVDALSFTGGNIQLTIMGMVDLTDDVITGVTQLIVDGNGTVVLSQAELIALGAANLLPDSNNSTTAHLILTDVTTDFDATTIADGIVVDSITLAGDTTLTSASNFTGVGQIFVPEGSIVDIPAALFQQLDGAGIITIVDTNGDATFDAITVNITGLTQVDVNHDLDGDGIVDAGEVFDLSGIDDNAMVTVALAEDVALNGNTDLDDLTRLEIIMSDDQTLTLDNSTQADGLVVGGGSNTTVVFSFITLDNSDEQIDTVGYAVDQLHAINVFFTANPADNSKGQTNSEYIIQNLDSSVDLVIFYDPDALGFVNDVNRTIIIQAGVSTPGELVLNDIQVGNELVSADVTFLGDSWIDGHFRLPTVDAGLLVRDDFGTLTIHSEGSAPNGITGDVTGFPMAPGNPNPTTEVENNVQQIDVIANQDFVFGNYDLNGDYVSGGGLFFSSNDDTQAVAVTLNLSGTGSVMAHQIDISDNNSTGSSDINTLNIVSSLDGTFELTGGTAAIMGDNAEIVNLSGSGDMVFGSQGEGVESTTISTINASGLTGDLDLGEIVDVDSTDFSFTSGTGVTMVNLTTDTLNVGPGAVAGTDTDGDGIDDIDEHGWSFDFSNAAAGSRFDLGALTFTSGSLDINLGVNTTLYINQDTDLRNIDLTLLQTLDIVLADEVELKINADQANGLNIISGVDADGDGNLGVVNVSNLGDGPVDLSGIAADIAGTITLEDDDVTCDLASDLGDFSVTLGAISSSDTLISGQTVRFTTVAQAAREVIVTDDDGTTWVVGAGGDDMNNTNSTNVVWLFDTITDSVDTGNSDPTAVYNYDANLGRLWVTPELVGNSPNIEELFTTLPDSIIRIEFSSLTDLNFALSSASVDRIVELVTFTDLSATGLQFNDQDRYEHVRSLTLKLGGEVHTGDIALDNIIAPSTNPNELDPTNISFEGLTIESHLINNDTHFLAPENFVNDGDGNDESGEHILPTETDNSGNIVQVVGDIGVGASNGLDFLMVTLDTLTANGADLKVGTVTFDSEVAASTATVVVTGDQTTQVASFNVADPQITTLNITNSGTGPLMVTGASPAAAVADTENLVIAGSGAVTLGTAGDLDKPGVAGAELSSITVTNSGAVDLGVIAQIDGSDDTANDAFTLDGFSVAQTTATLDEANVNSVLTAPTLEAGSIWNFQDATINFTDKVVLNAGTVNFTNAALIVIGDVDFTTLLELTVTVADVTIDVPAGSTLRILAEDADGLTVTGDGTVTIANLEATPAADLSDIMTTDGDTGTVEAEVATVAGTDVNFTGNLGKAHVTTTGDGIFDVTGATLDTVAFDHDGDGNPIGGTADQVVMSSFTVGAGSTLEILAAQADDHTVDGAGTTAVSDIGVYAGGADMSLAGVNSSFVNIAVDTDVTLDSDDNLGAAGPSRITTVAPTATLTSAGSVVNGQYITSDMTTTAGTNATLVVDDENDHVALGNPTDTPITADLSNVTVEYISLVDGAEVGTIIFPTLYGDPVAKYVDDPATVAVGDPNADVAVQTVTMSAAQASGQTINGASAGVEGEVIVLKLGAGATILSGILAGKMTANVPVTATLDGTTNLGSFDVTLNDTVTLTASAAQAQDLNFTEVAGATANVAITALETTPGADLSGVAVDTTTGDASTETAALDSDGDVALSANLGEFMTVNVTDTNAATNDTVTFTGLMDSATTTFDLQGDNVTLKLSAADATDLTVTDSADFTSVLVRDLGSAKADFNGVNADTLEARVSANATLDAATDIDSGTVDPYLAITGVATDGTAFTAESSTYTLLEHMNAGQSLTIDGLTVTATQNGMTAGEIASVFAGGIVTGLALSGAAGVPGGWAGANVTASGDSVIFTNTAAGDVGDLTVSVGSGGTVNNNFSVILGETVELGLSTAQLLDISVGDLFGTAGGVTETLVVSAYNGENIQSDELGAGVVIKTLTVTSGTALVTNNVTVDAAADLTQVMEIVIPQYSTLTMSADQFMAIMGNAGVTVSGAGTLNITGLDDTNASINLGTVTAGAGSITTSAADPQIALDPLAVIDNASGSMFSIIMDTTTAAQAFTVSSETQADGRTVTAIGANNSTFILGFINADASDADAIIESAGYAVNDLWVINSYIENEFGIAVPPGATGNFEYFLHNLDESILTTIVDVDTVLSGGFSLPTYIADPTDRRVDVAVDTGLDAALAFSDLDNGEEVGTLTMGFHGNSVITGDLSLPQPVDPQASIAAATAQPNFFDTLTINSANDLGTNPGSNEIQGNIFADDGTDGALSESAVETFTLTLDTGMMIDGSNDQIQFDGQTISLTNGMDENAIATALQNASFTHWTATAVGNVVTFANRDVGDLTDTVIGDFTFVKNGLTTASFPGTSAVALVTQGIFAANENNLYNVVIQADHDLILSGELELSYVTRSDVNDAVTVPGVITINGNSNVTIGSVNSADIHISGVTLIHNGTGVVTAPGTSPGAAINNTEELRISTKGTVTLGTDGDVNKPGVAGDQLSLILINGEGYGGDVNLGVISDVDPLDFTLMIDPDADSATDVTATLAGPTLAAGGTWTFQGTSAAGVSEIDIALTITDATTFGAGSLVMDDVAIAISGAVDFSNLASLNLTDYTINIPNGASLTLAGNVGEGLVITGAGTLILVGDELDAQDFSELNVSNIDMSNIATAENNNVDLDLSTHATDFNIIGSNFDDIIATGTGADTVNGGLGDDSLTGNAGIDSLNGAAGNDTLVGAQDDVLLEGGADADLLQIGANFEDTGDAQINGIETVTLTTDGLTVSLNDQTEAFVINGTAGIDDITAGSGNDTINGLAGADILDGGAGDDSIDGGDGSDSIDGGLGNDTIDAGAGADTINGGTGADVITGGADADVINGDAGDDTILGADNADTIDGGADNDTLQLSAGYAPVGDANLENLENVTVTGNAAAVVVDLANQAGEAFNVTLSTFGDTVTTADGADTITGGTGADDITAGDGANTVNAGAGADTVTTGAGADTIDAGADNDIINSGAGDDSVVAGAGDDTIDAGAGADTVDGGAGADVITGGADADVINGDAGDDTIMGADNTDTIDGGADNDTLQLSAGYAPVADANLENLENVTVTGNGVAVVVDLANQAGEAFNVALSGFGDTVTTADGADTIAGGVGNDNITSGDGADSVTAGDGNDIISAGAGSDTIDGGVGNDSITGGADADSISGGVGADTIVGADAADTIDGGADVDTLQLSASYTPAADANLEFVENVTVTGNAAAIDVDLSNQAGEAFNVILSDFGDSVTTADGLDTITGGTGADVIDAGAGNDVVSAGAGNDTVTAGIGADTVDGGDGDDSLDGGDGADSLTGGLGADTITAGADADTVVAGDGADVITGGTGDDEISAGAGDDTIVGADAADTINGGADNDTLQLSASYTPAADANLELVENVTVTGNGAAVAVDLSNQAGEAFIATLSNMGDTITTADGVDSITGGSGADVIDAGVGADTIAAGGGDDNVIYDAADATVDGGTGSSDTLDASGSVGAVSIDLSSAIDNFSGFENIIGSAFADTLTGDNQVNQIDGGAGNDTIDAGAGADTINAGAGDDKVFYDSADAAVDGGADSDTLTAENATGSVAIDLSVGGGVFTNFENLMGGDFNDTLTGGTDANVLTGGLGDDVLAGGEGNDTLTGGEGVDTFVFSAADANAEVDTITDWGLSEGDLLSGALGVGDQLDVTFGVLAPNNQAAPVVAAGAGGNPGFVQFLAAGYDTGDVITVTIGTITYTHTVLAGATSANAVALAFETLIESITPPGDVDLTGGSAMTSVSGDTLTIANNNSGDGAFIVTAGILNVNGILFDADDSGAGIAATDGVVSVTGGTGDDTIIGGAGNDTLLGMAGNDVLTGMDGDDSMVGAAGDDIFTGGAGADTFVLLGDDTVADFNSVQTDVVTLTGLGATDTVTFTSVTGTLDLTSATDGAKFVATAAAAGASITGDVGADTLNGAAGADTLDGAAGNDVIDGGAGADLLTGGLGDDSVTGGAGDDTIVGANADDTIDGGADTDTLQLSVGYAPTGDGNLLNVENVTVTGNGAGIIANLANQTENLNVTLSTFGDTITTGAGIDTITGGTGADSITSGAGVDVITGGTGADTIDAGTGDDTIIGADAADFITGGGDTDTLQLSASYTPAADGNLVTVENVTVTGNAAAVTIDLALQTEAFNVTLSTFGDTITTGGANDTITGGTGADSITTGAGTDYVAGGTGNDTILTGADNDTISGADNNDSIDGGAGAADVLLVSANYTPVDDAHLENVENVTVSGNAAAVAIDLSLQLGESFAVNLSIFGDTITTADGVDTITGNSGADSISAGAGDDIINGGAGADTIDGGAGADTITLTVDGAKDDIQIADVATTDTVANFLVGAANDQLDFSFAALQAAAIDAVFLDDAVSMAGAADPVVFATITAATDLATVTANSNVLIANLAANIADTNALETALETGGGLALTVNNAWAVGDTFLAAYDDGANTYIAQVVVGGNGALDNETFAATELTATNLVQLTGVADVTTLDVANFDFI